MLNKILEKTEECFQILEKKYNRNFVRPQVVFDLKGRSAGMTCSSFIGHKIRYNKILLTENFEDFISTTVPHEVCHIVEFQIYGKAGHGPNWKNLFRNFVADPKRCHKYDTSNVITRKQRTVKYACGCGLHDVSMTVHNRMQSGVPYHCNKCKRTLVKHDD